MSGKRAFLELLKQEGVEMVFGNPGTTELPLMDAFAVEHDIRYVLGLQEAALMSMADGYAQASGKLAVLNLHVAPGLGNAMGMLYDAVKAAAPILLTAGQQDLEYLVTESVPSTASFPASHPLFRGATVRTQAAVRQVLDQYDVLFSVGGDLFTLSLPSDIDPMPPGMRLIHLDTDPWEIGKNYPAEVAILGDPKATLPELTAATRERMSSGVRGAARNRLKTASDATLAERAALKAKARSLAGQTPVLPLALLEAIGDMLPSDAVVI